MKSRQLGRPFGALLCIVLAVAASVTSASPVGGATKGHDPIKIGTTYWYNPSNTLNQFAAASQAAIRGVNNRGGIDGHPLKLITCSETSPNEAETCARSFISDGVVATISDAALNDEAPYDQILQQAGIPQIDPFLTLQPSFADPNVYLLSGEANIEYATTLAFAKFLHIKTYHMVEEAIPSAAAVGVTVGQAAQYYGVQEVGSPTQIPLTAADFSPFVEQVASVKGGLNVMAIPPGQTSLFVQASQQLGTTLQMTNDAQFSIAEAKKYGESGGALSQAVLADALPPLSAAKQYPALKQYMKDMTAEYKSGDTLADQTTISPEAVERWLAGEVFAEVAKNLLAKGNAVTARNVKHYLDTAKNLSLLGLLPPWTPSKKGPAGFERVSQPYLYLMTIRNGQVVLFQKKPINGLLPFEK